MTKQIATEVPKSILIEGAPEGRRYTIIVDRKTISIPQTSFRIFAMLALVRWNDHMGGGWVYKSELGLSEGNEAAYLYECRRYIGYPLAGKRKWEGIEYNGEGSWRIAAPPEALSFNFDNLRNFPDHRLTRLLPPLADCRCVRKD